MVISKFSIDIVEVPACDEIFRAFRGVRIRINDVDLLDLILDFENSPGVAEVGKKREQSRTWPICNARTKKFLRGCGYYRDGTVPLVDCRCQCEGCWPIDVKIIRTASVVKWKNFRNGHRPSWPYSELGPFCFDRRNYDEEIAKIA